MSESKDFRESLQLPNTSFPMKARLQEKEPEIIKYWQDNNIHQKIQDKRKGSKTFFMQDGPPYANGKIHLGHVLNKILKDAVIKYKNLAGYQAPFIPTWDCHGLPIEMAALKKSDSKNLTNSQIRAKCREEARHWINEQKQSFQRLGVIADWDRPLLTMDSFYEAEQLRALAKIAKRGLLYRGTKPVFWCFKLQTAIAFSEAEYRDHKSPSIYVKFELDKSSQQKLNCPAGTCVVIWTTTPWTLSANAGISLHPDFEYSIYETKKGFYILATELAKNFFQELNVLDFKKIKSFKGKELEGLSAKHPFIDRKSPLVLGTHVNLESGTGAVHTAPGHGLDDYFVGLKYNLEKICHVDAKGHFVDTEQVPDDLKGVFIFKGNKIILNKLEKSGHLLSVKEINHSYPYNPRSDSPLIYRLTAQWFLALDQKLKIRAQALKASSQSIHFIPDWGKNRLEGMLKSTPDWCLSRQRVWGVPLAVFYCEDCKTPLVDSKIINHIADKMEASQEGIEYYFSKPTSELLPKNQTCPSCHSTNLKKETDILDVWFDSGIQHAVFKKTKNFNLPFPADLYLEGSDQHRGWFQTSLISSLAIDNTLPFKALLTHGFVNDKDGKKMSKSKGNVLDPASIIKKSGAEILRMWVFSENYTYDMKASDNSFKRVTESYRKFRNTIRFLLGNLNDFDISKHEQEYKHLNTNDKYALYQLNSLIENCQKSYDEFAFYKVYHLLNQFFTVTLSAFYLDIIKDRLYTFAENSPSRRAAQTVIYRLLESLLPMMAPLTSFLSEEAYTYFSGKKQDSILLEDFPSINPQWNNIKLVSLFDELFILKEDLNKQVEVMRQDKKLGSHLQASAILKASPKLLEYGLKQQEWLEFFSVSQLIIEPCKNKSSISAELAKGDKCLRCWFVSEKLNTDKICPKCVSNLDI